MAGVPKSVHGSHPDAASVGEGPLHPQLKEVEEFFLKNNYPIPEAKKFFNHYQSNGWLVGGKTPMKDWHSSAHKWMLNAPNFNPQKSNPTKPNPHPGPLRGQADQLNQNKNYDEPL